MTKFNICYSSFDSSGGHFDPNRNGTSRASSRPNSPKYSSLRAYNRTLPKIQFLLEDMKSISSGGLEIDNQTIALRIQSLITFLESHYDFIKLLCSEKRLARS